MESQVSSKAKKLSGNCNGSSSKPSGSSGGAPALVRRTSGSTENNLRPVWHRLSVHKHRMKAPLSKCLHSRRVKFMWTLASNRLNYIPFLVDGNPERMRGPRWGRTRWKGRFDNHGSHFPGLFIGQWNSGPISPGVEIEIKDPLGLNRDTIFQRRVKLPFHDLPPRHIIGSLSRNA